MRSVQVGAPVGRRCGRRDVRGRDDCVSARRGGLLGGVVRAVSDDLPRARGPGQASRGGPQDRESRRRRESRPRHEVWRAVDPVAGRDPGRARDRPSCRRASSRCAGAAVAATAGRLSVSLGSTFRERASFEARACSGRGSTRSATSSRGLQPIRSDSPATRGCSWGESDRTPAPSGGRMATTGSSPFRSRGPQGLGRGSDRPRESPFPRLAGRCSRRQKCSSLNESGALPALLDPAGWSSPIARRNVA
jgi:hypothetical protein